MDRIFSHIFRILTGFFFILLFTCNNNLISVLEQDVMTASLIDPPELTGNVITNNPTPSWNWDPVPDAEFYRYGFSEDSWIASSTTALTYTPASPLPEGIYTLYVQSGKSSNIWSESTIYTTEIDLTPPVSPVVTGPSITMIRLLSGIGMTWLMQYFIATDSLKIPGLTRTL